jgi:hypothetical protein
MERKRIPKKGEGHKKIQVLLVTAAVVFSALTLPAAAQQSGPLNVNDVAEQMAPETLESVYQRIVQPVKNRFPDRAAATALLGEPLERKITKHQSIHDPDYVFEEVVLQYRSSQVTFYVFPDREVFNAFEGDPAEAGIDVLQVGQAAAEVEKLLGQSVRRPKDMLYSDGEWWLVRLPLDNNDRLQSVELYIFFD